MRPLGNGGSSRARGLAGLHRLELFAYSNRQPDLGETVLPQRGELHKKVYPVEDRRAESLFDSWEHVFGNLRWATDGTAPVCKHSCRRSAAHVDYSRRRDRIRVPVAVLARLATAQPEVEIAVRAGENLCDRAKAAA